MYGHHSWTVYGICCFFWNKIIKGHTRGSIQLGWKAQPWGLHTFLSFERASWTLCNHTAAQLSTAKWNKPPISQARTFINLGIGIIIKLYMHAWGSSGSGIQLPCLSQAHECSRICKFGPPLCLHVLLFQECLPTSENTQACMHT